MLVSRAELGLFYLLSGCFRACVLFPPLCLPPLSLVCLSGLRKDTSESVLVKVVGAAVCHEGCNIHL